MIGDSNSRGFGQEPDGRFDGWADADVDSIGGGRTAVLRPVRDQKISISFGVAGHSSKKRQ